MIQASQDALLLHEAFAHGRAEAADRGQLYRDVALEAAVDAGGAVDAAHTAFGNEVGDPVAVEFAVDQGFLISGRQLRKYPETRSCRERVFVRVFHRRSCSLSFVRARALYTAHAGETTHPVHENDEGFAVDKPRLKRVE